MKLFVIGCGRCGGRVADRFAEIGRTARSDRRLDIVLGTLAVATTSVELNNLAFVADDLSRGVVIGAERTGGRGVGRENELAAEIAREEGDRVLRAVADSPRSLDADAFLLIAAAAGGTGSGAVSVLTRQLKERYPEKPAYNLIILPTVQEERAEPAAVINAATCLKSAYVMAEAVFLVDNEKLIGKDSSLRDHPERTNAAVVQPFYNLLCAGEERNPRFIGAKTLDAGDIVQSLSGWTAIGYAQGKAHKVVPELSIDDTHPSGDEVGTVQRAGRLVHDALNDLSLECKACDARSALYLLTAPHEAVNINHIQELGGTLKRVAEHAIIRGADYPREKRSMELSLILSEIVEVPRVTGFFDKALQRSPRARARRGPRDEHAKPDEEAFSDIPLLV